MYNGILTFVYHFCNDPFDNHVLLCRSYSNQMISQSFAVQWSLFTRCYVLGNVITGLFRLIATTGTTFICKAIYKVYNQQIPRHPDYTCIYQTDEHCEVLPDVSELNPWSQPNSPLVEMSFIASCRASDPSAHCTAARTNTTATSFHIFFYKGQILHLFYYTYILIHNVGVLGE